MFVTGWYISWYAGNDLEVYSLDAGATPVLSLRATGLGKSKGASLAFGANEELYVTGWYWGNNNFSPELTEPYYSTYIGGYDVFLLKMWPDEL